MDLLVYDEDDRRYVPFPVALAGLLVVVLLGLFASAGSYLAARSPQPETRPVSGLPSPQAGTVPPPADAAAPGAPDAATCPQALDRADVVLQRAGRLDQALAAHTRALEDVLAGRSSAQEALDSALPVLTGAATDRRLFAEERAAYTAARDVCAG